MWTYIKHDNEAEKLPNQPALPPEGTAYRAFDALCWKQVIGFTEVRIGCGSFLNPNVDDDCILIAFAPLDEPTEPDEAKLIEAWGIGVAYPNAEVPKLLLSA
jgi:hypothetical protein